MKSTIISFLTVIFIFSGCTLFKNTTQPGKMQVVNAGYNNWSKPPIRGDVPEKGTDLAIIVKNWPKDATPQYIIHEHWKSLAPIITDNTKLGTVINARIIKASSIINRTSKQVEETDRLVYETADGQTKFIEIPDWEHLNKNEDQ